MRRAGPLAAAALVLATSLAGCASDGRGILRPVYFPGDEPGWKNLPVTSALSIVPAAPTLVLGAVLGLPAAPFAGRWSFFVSWLVSGAILTPVYVPFWIVGNTLDAAIRLPGDVSRGLGDVPSAPAEIRGAARTTTAPGEPARSENEPARTPGVTPASSANEPSRSRAKD